MKKHRSKAQKAATRKMMAARRASLRHGGAREEARKPRRSKGRRKPRSKAQKAATRKMQAARRASMHGGRRKKRSKGRSKKRHSHPGERTRTKAQMRRLRSAAAKRGHAKRKRLLAAKEDGQHTGSRGKIRKQPRRKKASGKKGTASYRPKGSYKKSHTKGRRAWLNKHPDGRKGRKRSKGRGRRKGQTAAQRRASLRNIKKAQRALRSKGRRRASPKRMRSKGKQYSKRMARAGGGTRALATHRGRMGTAMAIAHARRGARDNPISVGGILAGVGLGVPGAVGAELFDRWLATRSWTIQAGTPNANGPQPADPNNVLVLPQGAQANISSAMGIWRWVAGIGLTFVPFGLSALPVPVMVKTGLRGFGIGAGIRTGLKGSIDLLTMLLGKTTMGERLFNHEIVAHNETKGGGSIAGTYNLVTYAGAPWKGVGAGHAAKGAGSCCSECASGRPCKKNPPVPPTEAEAAAMAAGAGHAQPQSQAAALPATPQHQPPVTQHAPARVAVPAFDKFAAYR